MDFERSDLPSGICVFTEKMPDVRSVALGFWIRIGSRDEAGADTGASHFLEHLLFKGTERRTAKQIAEEMDAIGGDMNAFTSKEYTCFHARVLDRDIDVAGDLLGDMLRHATIAEEDVEQERQVVLEEINIHYDTPDDLVHTDFAEVLLGDHPLAREVLGTAASIEAMSRDQVHGYYDRWYRPANIIVSAAGNVDHDTVVDLVERMVGDLGRPAGSSPDRSAPDDIAQRQVRVRNRPTEQAHVVVGGVGLPRDDERRFALMVANTALGGGMSSRLFQEIRELRGLAYSTYSYSSSFADSGYHGAYAGTTPTKIDELLKVMVDELDRFTETVDVAEVERAKGNLKGGIVLGLEDTGSRMTRLGKMVITESELMSVDEAIRRIEIVDVDAVREVAAATYGAPRSLAVVGPFEDASDRFAAYVE